MNVIRTCQSVRTIICILFKLLYHSKLNYCLIEYGEIHEKGSGDVVSAVCVQRDR